MIYVIIVSMYERFQTMKRNLATLDLPQSVTRHILVQGCPPEKMVHYSFIRVDVIFTSANLGCGGGRQSIVDRIEPKRDDILVFLDDDIYATNSNWLSDLVQPIQDGRAEIVGVEGRRLLPNLMTEVDRVTPDYISGGWCAMAAEVFHTGCRFDDQYLNYYEDVDFCRQAIAKGARLHVVGDIGLVHESLGNNSAVMLESRQKFAQKWGFDLTGAR